MKVPALVSPVIARVSYPPLAVSTKGAHTNVLQAVSEKPNVSLRVLISASIRMSAASNVPASGGHTPVQAR